MNSASKRAVIKGAVKSDKGDFLFIQETKMEVIDEKVSRRIRVFPNANFGFCPSRGTSAGIILLWNSAF